MLLPQFTSFVNTNLKFAGTLTGQLAETVVANSADKFDTQILWTLCKNFDVKLGGKFDRQICRQFDGIFVGKSTRNIDGTSGGQFQI